ncbi:transmembrane protein, putative (macronuclear) [Tetrahymena thermophila SB210]|uniref:Transmembrane protein, putative n=1 Tax=Tetrahymena thermophila (strain SB210) TaxID=312017 RepID=W7XLJ5_TETTS|nr:transmembrane protein, putative [Tetrahymena thermophila SB210]EWS76399.1 transmembrane protein, putative [Tetrahymena thermophila SB210]|eukprot:XP_012651183.1 transmembrane protein, putative [Tetrahymena thermophila SB210]
MSEFVSKSNHYSSVTSENCEKAYLRTQDYTFYYFSFLQQKIVFKFYYFQAKLFAIFCSNCMRVGLFALYTQGWISIRQKLNGLIPRREYYWHLIFFLPGVQRTLSFRENNPLPPLLKIQTVHFKSFLLTHTNSFYFYQFICISQNQESF